MRRSIRVGVVSLVVMTAVSVVPAWANPGDLVWAQSFGGTSTLWEDRGQAMAVDAAGNVYTVGQFNGKVDFDPGPGVVELNAGGLSWMFILKLDAAGNLVWVRAVDGSETRGNDIAVDHDGNVYITGTFKSLVDFDPGPNEYEVSSKGSTDVFVLKLDADGGFRWVRNTGNPAMGTEVDATGVAVNGQGRVHVTGRFRGTLDFDPGDGELKLTSTGNQFNDGFGNAFVWKLKGNGDLDWARAFGTYDGTSGFGVAVDDNNNVYTTGQFIGTGDFDPGAGTATLTARGGTDVFVSKLSPTGAFVWVKALGGTAQEQGVAVATRGSDVLVTGRFQGTVDFDPGAGTFNLTSKGDYDAFVVALNSAGNRLWAKSMGGTGDDEATGVAVDGSGNVYAVGSFQNTVDFDPGPKTLNKTSAGSSDIFVTKLTSSGDLAWVRIFGSSSHDHGYGLVVDATGNTSVTGTFRLTVDFDPGSGTHALVSNGGGDIFVTKLGTRPFCRGILATIVGTEGPDVIHGTEFRDVIMGLGGDDIIFGYGGNDLICAGDGNDTVYGGDGRDKIYGDDGDDTLYGEKGSDWLYGGKGADNLQGGKGPRDKLFGGPGTNLLNGGQGDHDQCTLGPAFKNCEVIIP